jgi:hypothetical protein
MEQIKDVVGATLRDRLFGGLAAIETFVASRVPPGYRPEVTSALEVVFLLSIFLLCGARLMIQANHCLLRDPTYPPVCRHD